MLYINYPSWIHPEIFPGVPFLGLLRWYGLMYVFAFGFAYMALCCYEMKLYTEFLEYLKKACQRNPKECKLVLSHIFPNEVEPKDYYAFLQGKITP